MISESSPQYVSRFSLNITRAMREQLVLEFDQLEWVPLTPSSVSKLPEASGVYRLKLNGRPVYVGKSDGKLRSRLGQHLRKISSRRDPEGSRLIETMEMQCVLVEEDLNALAPEKMLIEVYKKLGQADWNYNGFGNKDPGQNRDETLIKANHFDRAYPLDLDSEIGPVIGLSAAATVADLVFATKKALKFNFRVFETSKPQTPGPLGKVLLSKQYSDHVFTPRGLLETVASELPRDWQLTVLPGYAIAYPETAPAKYASRIGYWPGGALTDFVENENPIYAKAARIASDEK